jgi:hypothetical protein
MKETGEPPNLETNPLERIFYALTLWLALACGAPAAELPDLAPILVDIPSTVTDSPNPQITLTWGSTNQGANVARRHVFDAVYISTNRVLDSWASRLQTVSRESELAVGSTDWHTNLLRLPVTQSGTYYLLFYVDAGDYTVEADEANNILAISITFNILPPDLTPVTFQAPTTVRGPPNPSVKFVWKVANQGPGEIRADSWWYDSILLSTNGTVSGAISFASFLEKGPFVSGASYWRTNTVAVPVVRSGNYFFIFSIQSSESDRANNLAVLPVTFDILLPDLAPMALQVTNVVIGPPLPVVSVSWCVTNQGVGTAVDTYRGWEDSVRFSTNLTLDPIGTKLGSWPAPTPIPAGAGYWRTNMVSAPVRKDGTYYFLFKTDSADTLLESNETNNQTVLPVSFIVQPIDLMPMTQLAPVLNVRPNPIIKLVWGLTNLGTGPVLGSQSAVVRFSTEPKGPSWRGLAVAYSNDHIPGGGCVWWTNEVQLPVSKDGTYYLTFAWNLCGVVPDSNTSNDEVVVPVTLHLSAPRLRPAVFLAPATITNAPNPWVTFIWGVTNFGNAAAFLGDLWSDVVYLSTTPSLQPSSAIFTNSEHGPLAPGEIYWRTNTVMVPIDENGTYYISFQPNADGAFGEPAGDSNTVVVPVSFKMQLPDLAPVLLKSPSHLSGSSAKRVSISYAVTNQGVGTALAPRFLPEGYLLGWRDRLFLSTTPTLDGAVSCLPTFSESGPIDAAQNYWRTWIGTLPVTANGPHYLILQVNADGDLQESTQTNNTLVIPVNLDLLWPEIELIALAAPAIVEGCFHPSFTVAWGVTNAGPGSVPANSYRSDRLYLSSDAVLDWQDTYLHSSVETAPLPVGGIYWQTNTVVAPITVPGQYYLILILNDSSSAPVGSNNMAVIPVAFTPSPPPDLTPTALQAPRVWAGAPNPQVPLVWAVTNLVRGGVLQSYWWTDAMYLSKRETLDETALALHSFTEAAPLIVAGSYWRTNYLTVPMIDTGDFYLLFKTDACDDLSESVESNNVVAVLIRFELSQPDLEVSVLQTAFPLPVPPNPYLAITWVVTNRATAAAVGESSPWLDSLYLSRNPLLDGTAIPLGSWMETNTVAASGAYWRTNLVRLPVTQSGDYYLILVTDAENRLSETNAANNRISFSVSLRVEPPDLAPVALLGPASIAGPPNSLVTLTWGVTNSGTVPALGGPLVPEGCDGWRDALYLARQPVLDGSEVLIGYWTETNSVPAQGSYWRTNTMRLPTSESGIYYLIFQTGRNGGVPEMSTTNNTLAVPIVFELQTPDLRPIAWLVPNVVTGAPYPVVTLVMAVTNQGTYPALGQTNWIDAVYLSPVPDQNFAGYPVSRQSRSNTLAPGDVYWETNQIWLPVADSGTYYLFLNLDDLEVVPESDRLNNAVMAKIKLELSPPPQLELRSLAVLSVVTDTAEPCATLAWEVVNSGFGPALNGWMDLAYLLTNPVPSWSDQPLCYCFETNTLSAGASCWQTNTIPLPAVPNGSYYLVVWTDAFDVFLDPSRENQFLAVPIQLNLGTQPLPTIAGGRLLQDGTFALTVYGVPETEYVLQSSTNLVNWTDAATFRCVEIPTSIQDPEARGSSQRFYRVRLPQPIPP